MFTDEVHINANKQKSTQQKKHSVHRLHVVIKLTLHKITVYSIREYNILENGVCFFGSQNVTHFRVRSVKARRRRKLLTRPNRTPC